MTQGSEARTGGEALQVATEEDTSQEEQDGDDYESLTSSPSPTPVRRKKLKHSIRRAPAHSIGREVRSTIHQSNKRPFGDTTPKSSPSKRSKTITHVDNDLRTPGTNFTSTKVSVDLLFWDEWDMKQAATTNSPQLSDQSVKAGRVWRLVSMKHSSELTRNRLVIMVLAIANRHAFRAVKEVMDLLQHGRVAQTSEIFSNDPKVLMETVSTIETAGHMNSYIRRFALARLGNMYLQTAANGGLLALDGDRANPSPQGVVTKARKAGTYNTMILHIWGVQFPASYKGTKMTREGLIEASTADALQWNTCKRRLRQQVDAGQRWLRLATRFGWSSLSLITRDWSIGERSMGERSIGVRSIGGRKVIASDGL